MEELLILMKKWLPEVTVCLGIPPLLLSLFRKVKHEFNIEINAIKPYLYLLFIGAIYELIFTNIFRVYTCYLFTAFAILEFLTLWFFFKKILLNKYTYFFWSFFLIVLIESIIILFYWECSISEKFEGYLAIPISVFVFASSFLWFKQLFKRNAVISLWNTPLFYFLSGLVIYFAGGLFISLMIYEINILTGLPETYWLFFLFGAIIMRIMLIIGIWKATEKKP